MVALAHEDWEASLIATRDLIKIVQVIPAVAGFACCLVGFASW